MILMPWKGLCTVVENKKNYAPVSNGIEINLNLDEVREEFVFIYLIMKKM